MGEERELGASGSSERAALADGAAVSERQARHEQAGDPERPAEDGVHVEEARLDG